jgi:hypothetical protein
LMGGLSYNDVVEGSKAAAEAKLYPVRVTIPISFYLNID